MSFTTDVSFLHRLYSARDPSLRVSMSFTTDVSFLPVWETSTPAPRVCLNVLYYGRLISTVITMFEVSIPKMSQCPLLRTSHFHSKTRHLKSVWLPCLNVLYYGRLISTWFKKESTLFTIVSQCPLWRTSHFHWNETGKRPLCGRVSMSFMTDVSFPRSLYGDLKELQQSQCPLQRTSHFYEFKSPEVYEFNDGLNVLYNERLISTERSTLCRYLIMSSQCPLQRTSHFYAYWWIMFHTSREDVSMSFTTDVSFPHKGLRDINVTVVVSHCPLLRTSHFHGKRIYQRRIETICLNVLYYGRLISTSVPLTWITDFEGSQCPL